MPDDLAISVEGISKAYRIWDSPAARLISPLQSGFAGFLPVDSVAAQNLRKMSGRSYRDFYALQDVSFTVRRGESVGIVGRNGSGKSTLLQIIAGTLQPTSGKVKVKGRVAALLELGSGFNPEFTGRENVLLNAAILGFGQQEIEARMDEIESFADIGPYIDQPVKTYSSGMMVRLAFTVQTLVEPDILIVDEALAVGDQAFQRKCYARIESLRAQGTTILLVTHATTAVVEFCQRALFLHAGRLLLDGAPKPVIQQYQRLMYAPVEKISSVIQEITAMQAEAPKQADLTADARKPATDGAFLDPALHASATVEYPAQGARIENVRVETTDGRSVNHLIKYEEYVYGYEVHFERECHQVRFAHSFKTVTGIELGGTSLRSAHFTVPLAKAGQVAEVNIRFKCLFNAGTYLCNAGVMALQDDRQAYLHRIVDALIFRVLPEDEALFSGYVDFQFAPQVRILASKAAAPGVKP